MTQNSIAESSDESREGRYANHFYIGHNAFEVILEFGQFYEGNDKPLMHTRIVTSPAYALTFLQLMTSAIEQYESSFGSISRGRPHERLHSD
jgi:hypothetical protein